MVSVDDAAQRFIEAFPDLYSLSREGELVWRGPSKEEVRYRPFLVNDRVCYQMVAGGLDEVFPKQNSEE